MCRAQTPNPELSPSRDHHTNKLGPLELERAFSLPSQGCFLEMEIVLLILVIIFVLGARFLIPKSNKKGRAKGIEKHRNKKAYTKEDVSLHNRRDDCWIIIKGKVYDVTPYVEVHPGGDAILTHAGGDATEGFYGPQHASLVFDMVDEFHIGELKP